MYARYQLGATAVAAVVLEQQLARLLVQCRLGVGVDEQTFDGDQDVLDAVGRLPVLLERVHTDLAGI